LQENIECEIMMVVQEDAIESYRCGQNFSGDEGGERGGGGDVM
jgi:broad-specificity NMP kinase